MSQSLVISKTTKSLEVVPITYITLDPLLLSSIFSMLSLFSFTVENMEDLWISDLVW